MYKKILLAVDLNHEASWKKALPAACDMAKAFKAELHLINVVPDFGMASVEGYFPADFEVKALNAAEKGLEEFATRVPKGIKAKLHIGHGRIYDQILRIARKIDADLVVMGAHGPDMKTYLMGSNVAKVARHFAGSVFLVR